MAHLHDLVFNNIVALMPDIGICRFLSFMQKWRNNVLGEGLAANRFGDSEIEASTMFMKGQ
jgi:hypothetical protein